MPVGYGLRVGSGFALCRYVLLFGLELLLGDELVITMMRLWVWRGYGDVLDSVLFVSWIEGRGRASVRSSPL